MSCVCSVLASILRAWLDQCPEDFQEPPDYLCLHRLLDYLGKALPGSETLRRAERLLEQLQAQAGTDETEGNSAQLQRSTLHCTIHVFVFTKNEVGLFLNLLFTCFQVPSTATALSAWRRKRKW